MKKRARALAIVLATACVMILVVVFFEFYVEQTTITVQAWNDASISLGSGTGTWMFLYLNGSIPTYPVNFNFHFPFISFPSIVNAELLGKPTLILAWTNGTNFRNDTAYTFSFTLLNATKGTSSSLVGLKMTVVSANPSSTTLVLDLLS
jgi:hypothetical protein